MNENAINMTVNLMSHLAFSATQVRLIAEYADPNLSDAPKTVSALKDRLGEIISALANLAANGSMSYDDANMIYICIVSGAENTLVAKGFTPAEVDNFELNADGFCTTVRSMNANVVFAKANPIIEWVRGTQILKADGCQITFPKELDEVSNTDEENEEEECEACKIQFPDSPNAQWVNNGIVGQDKPNPAYDRGGLPRIEVTTGSDRRMNITADSLYGPVGLKPGDSLRPDMSIYEKDKGTDQ